MKSLSTNTKSNRIMEENKELNLVEILKGCPKGTKLYSTIFGEVEFENIDHQNKEHFPIYFRKCEILESVTKEGLHLIGLDGECTLFPSKENRDWSTFKVLKPKWNPDTLQPFDKVLVRDTVTDYWDGDFYLYTDNDSGSNYPCSCVSSNYKICIPYNEETKHLLGTNQEAPEFYRL